MSRRIMTLMTTPEPPAFKPLHLETPRLFLRHFRPNDLPTLMAYRNDEEVARYQSWGDLTQDQAAQFIERQQNQPVAVLGEWLQIALELKASGEHIGDLALNVYEQEQATFGYTLSRSHQGHGLMTEAATRLLDFLLKDLNLHRVSAFLDFRNERSMRLLERLGFRREGLFVEAYFDKGEWTSEYKYALLAREWHDRKPHRNKSVR